MTTTAPQRRASTGPAALRIFQRPSGLYHLLLGATLLLLLLGVVMVLSASSILSLKQTGSVYTLAQRQAVFAAIGLIAMAVATRLPQRTWRRFAWPVMIGAIVLLVAVLVPGIGVESMGQRNWIEVGPVRVQPAEFAKFALALWGAHVITRRGRPPETWRELLVPLVPMSALTIGLVLLGGDFGNVLMLAAIMAGVLFAAGAPLRLFAGLGVIFAGGVVALTVIAPHRMSRFSSFLNPSADPLGDSYQLTQGQYALGTGGWFGVGLGASREKWGSLPEAHTDFIFSVVGEELGLIGTVALLLVFGLIAFCTFQLAKGTSSQFVRLAAAGVGSWLVVQAVINLGGVLGLLPIAGVTLPLVSYGGSSLIPTLMALGMLMSFARTEAEQRAT
jgi:cell division protein FtsW